MKIGVCPLLGKNLFLPNSGQKPLPDLHTYHIMLHLMIVIRPYIDEAFITLLAFVRRQCIVHRFGFSEEVGSLLVLGK